MLEYLKNVERFFRRKRNETEAVDEIFTHGLMKVARRISENDKIKVSFYNPVDRIAPHVSQDKIEVPKTSDDEMEALVAHEAGHMGYGSFSPQMERLTKYLVNKYNIKREIADSIINVVEDYRVDTINEKIYPGFSRKMRILYHKILSENTEESFFKEMLCYFEDLIPDMRVELEPDQLERLDKAKKIIKNHQHVGASVFAADILGEFFRVESDNRKENSENEGEQPPNSDSDGTDCPSGCPMPSPLKKTIDVGMKPEEENSCAIENEKVDDKILEYMENFNVLSGNDKEKILESLLNEDETDTVPEKGTRLEKTGENLRQLLKYNVVFGKEAHKLEPARKVIEEIIDPTNMHPCKITYEEIIKKHERTIKQLQQYFHFRSEIPEKQFKSGRLNNTFIRAIVSDYDRCFSRKSEPDKKKITLIVDISGSMGGGTLGDKMHKAKEAMVIFAESLKEVADTRIVCFTGSRNAINIIVKDFGEKIEPKKFDLIGSRHTYCENLDGVTVLHEAIKNPGGILMIFSDGRPAGAGDYGLKTAIPDIQKAWTIVKTMFAFSIESKGKYLEKMYRKNYVNVSLRNEDDLIKKTMKMARQMIEQIY